MQTCSIDIPAANYSGNIAQARSVQAGNFEETIAVGGCDAQLQCAAGAVDCKGNLDTRVT